MRLRGVELFLRFCVRFAVFAVSTGVMQGIMEHESRSPQEALVKRARGGVRAAFDALAEHHRAKLLRWIHSRMSPPLRAKVEPEDLLQETLVWAHRSIGKLDWGGEEAFEHWLFSIAKHVVLKEAARRGGKGENLLECEPPTEESSPSQAMRRGERFDRLEAALQGLSPDHRRVVELARLRGMPIKEIASQMQRSPDAISQLLNRALKKLKESFGDTESLGFPDRSLGDRGGEDD
jgi:RNA polymerase sigma-70 factor, ECF subfamily